MEAHTATSYKTISQAQAMRISLLINDFKGPPDSFLLKNMQISQPEAKHPVFK